MARAVELGVNYFDTAALYGDGLSEVNLGRALAQLDVASAGRVVVVRAEKGARGLDFGRAEAEKIETLQRPLACGLDSGRKRLSRQRNGWARILPV